MRSVLSAQEIGGKLHDIVDRLFINIPSGVGSHRKDLRLGRKDLEGVLAKGARWAVEEGYGTDSDVQFIEDNGRIPFADPGNVSEKAYERGKDQLGTLGSGNHVVEVGHIT